MLDALQLAESYEREQGVLAVSIHAGFPWADIFEAGPSVAVTGDGQRFLFMEPAREGAASGTEQFHIELNWFSQLKNKSAGN